MYSKSPDRELDKYRSNHRHRSYKYDRYCDEKPSKRVFKYDHKSIKRDKKERDHDDHKSKSRHHHRRHKRDHHKSSKHKTKKNRNDSIEKKLSSSKFINEIIHNENVLKKKGNIVKNVIDAIENETNDSHTPPLPVEKNEIETPPPPPPPLSPPTTPPVQSKSISESEMTDGKTKKRKMGVLDLPMPPLVELPRKKISFKMNTFKSKGIDSSKKHAEEMNNHLMENSAIQNIFHPIISSVNGNKQSTPKKYPRPSVIGKTQSKLLPNNEMSVFSIMEQVGEGTYGKVYKAVNVVNMNIVAMKLIRMGNENQGFPITYLREIKNLQRLNHFNIIQLLDVVMDCDKNRTYLVFEYMNHDLLGLMANAKVSFSEGNIYLIISQVLEGLNHCHEKKIIHRDLKSSNILINNDGVVKLADFGLSRYWVPERPYTNKVISLWYRPIELLLGEERYTPVVDIWSVGCIMTELFKRSPLFPFSDEVDIVDAIFRLCGTPNSISWPEISQLPRYKAILHKNPRMRALRETLTTIIPQLAVDLIDKMLILNPNKRISAEEALQSNWMIHMRSKKVEPLKLPSIDCFEYRSRHKK